MTLLTDLARAARSLRNHRGFASSVIATLGVAVAATSVIVAVASQALLAPLPLRDSSKLLIIWEKSRGGDYRLPAYPTFLDWQRASPRALAGLGYARGWLDVLSTREGPVRATTAFVSPGFLDLLGATPMLGRVFTRDEEAAGRGDAAVLSEQFWRSQFGGDPAVVGRSITLSGRSVVIVGVLPASKGYPLWGDLWRPISAIVDTDPALASRNHHSDSRTIIRLRDGVAPAAAMADLSTVQQNLASTFADHGRDWTSADFKPLSWEFIGAAAPVLATLVGAGALMLLVACVNVAALLLLRAFARERELAIRSALGASPAGLVRLTLIECGLLGLAATGLAVALTWAGLTLVRTASPDAVPRIAEITFDGRVVALVLAVGCAATVLAMAASLVRVVRGGSLESLRAGWQPTSGGRAGNRWRGALASAQLAVALTLIAGSALLLESFRRLNDVNLGFEPRHLASFAISPPTPKYAAPEQAAALYARLQDAVTGVNGVEGVAIANHGPLGGAGIATKFLVPGRTPAADGSDAAFYKTVSASYLSVLKGRIVKGRWFTDADIREVGTGVVVNEQLAKRAWPDKDPIGQPITIFRSSQARPGFGDPLPSVVIGVIANIRNWSIADDPAEEVYVPYTREVWPGIGMLIRTRGDPVALERTIRRALLDVEPDLPVLGSARWRTFESVDANVARQLAPRRTLLALVMAFAVSALALAAMGVYGVIAFGVAQRRREFGIRMAVGATARDVVRLVLRQSMVLAGVGAVAGTAGALGLARAIRASLDTVLYRTSPFAVAPFAGAALLLGVIAVAAAWLPARRAGRSDPLVALRAE